MGRGNQGDEDGASEHDFAGGFALACPRCRAALERIRDGELRCPRDGIAYRREAGIWRFLALEPASPLARFAGAYRQVRRAEGWGSDDPAYYRALPYVDPGEPDAALWRIRAASFEVLARLLLAVGRRLAILDLGAGNGWLAHRLAAAGHRVAAVDLSDDPRDGLGALPAYGTPAPFLALQASFDRLPLRDAQADLAIFDGAFHYAPSYEATLAEALRVLRPDGRVAIVDSPFFRSHRAGRRMLDEKRRERRARHGAAGDVAFGEGYLSPRHLRRLRAELGLRWRRHPLPLGWRWHLAPWWARLRGRREPARFPVIVGRR